jgi:hypothetical protein
MRTDLAIINRTFWPHSPVIGKVLLELSEVAAESRSVCVITQSDRKKLSKVLSNAKRGKGVCIKACRFYSNINSNILTKFFDGFVFIIWTIYSLILTRPRKIYVSTNPPIFIPLIVFIYSSIYRAKYYCHVQDIHPEAANIIMPLNKFVLTFLSWLDSIVMRHAAGIMTLTVGMEKYIIFRSKTKAPILLIDNPAFIEKHIEAVKKSKDIVFCGTAGRFQIIPLLLESITKYLNDGGTLNFTFIGSGIYLPEIQALSRKFDSISSLGFLPSEKAANIVSQHRWGLLPINDEVTRYAFPSRSSSYIISNCSILAICSKDTSVSKWVIENKFGNVSEPNVKSIISHFKAIEREGNKEVNHSNKIDLSTAFFVKKILAFIGK